MKEKDNDNPTKALRIRKEKIFLVEGILKVRKKSGNRERCRKLSYEIASENTRDITTHPSKDMSS